MIRSLAVSLALSALAGCASKSASAPTSTAPASVTAAAARRSATLITEDEIAKTSARDGLHLIQLLRPDWLRYRGVSSLNGSGTEVVIYLNGQRLGGPESLRQLQATALRDLRYMSPSEATNRYGTGHDGGAILVRTK